MKWWPLALVLFFAFDKERLHNADAIENFGPFIDTNLVPPFPPPPKKKKFRDEIIQGKWHNVHGPRALFLAGVGFSCFALCLGIIFVEFDLHFAFALLSCWILESASLFILYVHDHGHLGFGMLTVETAVFDCNIVDLVPVVTEKVSLIWSNVVWNWWKSTVYSQGKVYNPDFFFASCGSLFPFTRG